MCKSRSEDSLRCHRDKLRTMEYFVILTPKCGGGFSERLDDLTRQWQAWLDAHQCSKSQLLATRVYLSDAINQWPAVENHSLYIQFLSVGAVSYVEQPPLSGCKIALALLVSTRNWSHAGTSERHVLSLGELRLLFHSVRYVSADVSGLGTYEQTERAFKEHVGWLQQYGLNLKDHCQRTWIYVRDIDRHYAPMVKARNAFFEENDLTPRTHFIASTGIEGYSLSPAATVAVDFFSVSGLDDGRILYLQAPEFLNPTYEYGVAFERGTRLSLPHGDLFLISGTASIDKHGVCLYPGDVVRQLDRLFLNIEALLRSGEAEMQHLRGMTVYLRDVSDYETVERYMQAHFPSVPYVITSARVCRPEWLVEVEAVGWKAIE